MRVGGRGVVADTSNTRLAGDAAARCYAIELVNVVKLASDPNHELDS